MKRALAFLVLVLFLAACAPPPETLVPLDTVVAQTMAALPPKFTPTSPPTAVPPTAPPAAPSEVPVSPPTEAPPVAQGAFTGRGAQCIPPDAERVVARVSRVVSGDMIEVALGNELQLVKYAGIKGPAVVPVTENYGPEAVVENKRLVGSQVVTLVKASPEKSADGGFLLRYVLVGDAFINYELTLRGFAKTDPQAPDLNCQGVFQAAEMQAQATLTGLWAPTPLPTATRTSTPTITPTINPTPATATSAPPCDCNMSNLNCNRFTSQAAAQACLKYCKAAGKDVSGLDKNNNGRACEGLP